MKRKQLPQTEKGKKHYKNHANNTSRHDSKVYLKFFFRRQLTSLLSRWWFGRIIPRRWVWILERQVLGFELQRPVEAF